MKFFAYIAFCLLLPFAVVADDADGAGETVPEEADSASSEDAAQTGFDAGFERFKTILDRMPFGRPPPGFDPDSPGGASASGPGGAGGSEDAVEVSEMEQQILSSVRVSALNVTPAGIITVGFTDSSVQPPRNYFMEVGEKRGEWTVVEADPDPEKKTVKLSKNGVEATLKLGGSTPQDGKGKSGAAASGGGAMMSGRAGGRMPFRSMGKSGAAGEGASGAEPKLTGLQIARARQEKRRLEMETEAAQRRQAFELAQKEREQAQKDRELAQRERELAAEQAQKEREQAAEERKAQLAQLTQIQEELRRQREERQAEEERRAAAGDGDQPQDM